MRYHKSFQYVATFVATAGAFVMLQGSAWADTTAPAAAVPATVAPDESAAVPPQADPSGSVVPPTDTSQPAVQGQSDKTPTVGGTSDAATPKQSDSVVPAAPPSDDKSQRPTDQPTGVSVNDLGQPVVVTTEPPADATERTALPSDTTPTDQPKPAILVRPATILTIQPTIRSHPAADVGDLAWNMPSAPVATKQPVPAKSNGALGELRLLLAGVVVPTTFVPHDWDSLRGAMVAIGSLAGLLLVSLYAFSYGLWLRRGGFVNAARSDTTPFPATSSLFATPQLLGYVTMPPHRHSPIFVVADIKFMIHEVLFPTLSERRT